MGSSGSFLYNLFPVSGAVFFPRANTFCPGHGLQKSMQSLSPAYPHVLHAHPFCTPVLQQMLFSTQESSCSNMSTHSIPRAAAMITIVRWSQGRSQ